MGAVVLRPTEKGVDEGGDEHHDRDDRQEQLGAVGEVSQKERVGEKGAAPEAEHSHVKHLLHGLIRAIVHEKGQDGGQEYDQGRGGRFRSVRAR